MYEIGYHGFPASKARLTSQAKAANRVLLLRDEIKAAFWTRELKAKKALLGSVTKMPAFNLFARLGVRFIPQEIPRRSLSSAKEGG